MANKIEDYDEPLPTAETFTAEGTYHWGLVLNGRSVAKTVQVILHWLKVTGITGK